MRNGKQISLQHDGKEIATATLLHEGDGGLACKVENSAGAVRSVALPSTVGKLVSPGIYEISQDVAQAIQKFLENSEAA